MADYQARYTLIKSLLVTGVAKYGAEPANWYDEAYAVNAANLMNTVEDVPGVEKASISIEELAEAFDATEESVLDSAIPAQAQKLRAIDRVFQIASSTGSVDIRAGTKPRLLLESALTGGGFTTTLGALSALLSQTLTEAASNSLGYVKPGDIQNAWKRG